MIDTIQVLVITNKRDNIKVGVEIKMIITRKRPMIIQVEANILMIEDYLKVIEIKLMSPQDLILHLVNKLIEINMEEMI